MTVIVITGPGRSGTSVIAELYLRLGYDPGGFWDERIRGGHEDERVVSVNEQIARALGVIAIGATALRTPVTVASARRVIPRLLQPPLRHVWKMVRVRPRNQPPMLQWHEVDNIAKRFASDMVRAVDGRVVVKDPRFMWTLPVWLAAGIPISHVVLSLRNLSHVAERLGALVPDWRRVLTDDGIANNVIYGAGLVVASCNAHRVPLASLSFPTSVQNEAALYEVLPFPEAVSRADFHQAFVATVRPEWTTGGVTIP